MNERPASDPLPSCGTLRGHSFFNAFRTAALNWARGRGLHVWVNRSLCQGFCDKEGVTLSVFPGPYRWSAVQEADIPKIISFLNNEIKP